MQKWQYRRIFYQLTLNNGKNHFEFRYDLNCKSTLLRYTMVFFAPFWLTGKSMHLLKLVRIVDAHLSLSRIMKNSIAQVYDFLLMIISFSYYLLYIRNSCFIWVIDRSDCVSFLFFPFVGLISISWTAFGTRTMNGIFNEQILVEKLAKLNSSQKSIESILITDYYGCMLKFGESIWYSSYTISSFYLLLKFSDIWIPCY